jgi:hypothetical protein
VQDYGVHGARASAKLESSVLLPAGLETLRGAEAAGLGWGPGTLPGSDNALALLVFLLKA